MQTINYIFSSKIINYQGFGTGNNYSQDKIEIHPLADKHLPLYPFQASNLIQKTNCKLLKQSKRHHKWQLSFVRNCLPPLWHPIFIATLGSELGLAVNLPSALLPGWRRPARPLGVPLAAVACGDFWIPRRSSWRWWSCAAPEKAALTLFACFFKLKLEFGCFARVPGVAEGGVCLYARNCQLRARQQFDSVVREAFSSLTGLHHTPSALLQRPLGSFQSLPQFTGPSAPIWLHQ